MAPDLFNTPEAYSYLEHVNEDGTFRIGPPTLAEHVNRVLYAEAYELAQDKVLETILYGTKGKP